MKIFLAKTAGFCEGVQKAVNRAFEIASKKKPGDKIYTYGPIIHNPQTLSMLEKQGIKILRENESTEESEIIIRTHGVTPYEHGKLKSSFSKVHNATCKKVARVQAYIKKHINSGYRVIIIGDAHHAEVLGLLGYSGDKGIVIGSTSEINDLEGYDNALIVSQTTYDIEEFQKIIKDLKLRFQGLIIKNTICNSTRDRQDEVKQMCTYVDTMVIVGGKGSANTTRLFSICKSMGIKAFHIENPGEINELDFSNCEKVGVTAGASTPRWLINQTMEHLENTDKKSFRGIMRRTAKFLVYSYLILSFGAASLSYVFTTYMQIPSSFAQALIAFLYVYALYNINVYFFRDTEERNKLEYSRFLHNNKIWLLSTTAISLAGVLLLSFFTGILSFIAVIFSILPGILFNVELFSGWLYRKAGVKSLRDIPGSKDIFTPLALSTVIVLAPALSVISSRHHIQDVIISFLITFSLIFLRSTLLHLVDIEEDRIVGRDTIPTYLGEKTTIKIVTYTVTFFIFALILLSITGIGWSGVWLFSLNAIALLIMIRLFFKRIIMSYFLFSLALDLNLILAGIVAYFGKMFY